MVDFLSTIRVKRKEKGPPASGDPFQADAAMPPGFVDY
jgi:hypothetical protein